MFVYLSHALNEETPLYGGANDIHFNVGNSIEKGAISNTKHYSFPNHSGTHIDFPLHFSDQGRSLNDYQAADWIFENVFTIFTTVDPDTIIDESNISIKSIPESTECLLISTDFQKYRGEEIYWKNNPGLAPSLAGSLKNRCPELKVIGFDFISLSSFQNRKLGRIAHKEFLVKHNILIIEDMKLDVLNMSQVRQVIALPLMVDNADGGPITVIGDMTDD